jgi:hypothetical protein
VEHLVYFSNFIPRGSLVIPAAHWAATTPRFPPWVRF